LTTDHYYLIATYKRTQFKREFKRD
jgi:hypothetical protein